MTHIRLMRAGYDKKFKKGFIMKNANTNDLSFTPPYTLDSLLGYLQNLPDYPLQRHLKDCLTDLKKLSADNVSPEALQRISNDMVELDLPLVGNLPWEFFTENLPWVEPYCKWAQCLAAGKNSDDCILPEEFLNWCDKVKPEPCSAKSIPTTTQPIDVSKPGQIFRANVLKMLIRNQRNYRRHLGTWSQELEDLYRQIQ